jgi:hypothetical protein
MDCNSTQQRHLKSQLLQLPSLLKHMAALFEKASAAFKAKQVVQTSLAQTY